MKKATECFFGANCAYIPGELIYKALKECLKYIPEKFTGGINIIIPQGF